MTITTGKWKVVRARISDMEKARIEPVSIGIFYFGGKMDGRLYSHCDTQEQADRYIADRHQSDDTNTFRSAPLYTIQPDAQAIIDGLTSHLNTAIRLGNALEQQRDELRAEISNMASKGQRLALELECLLLDIKDNAVVSKWWDSAWDAIEDWRKV